jgi:type VI secretion system ImpA/VasJ family protein
MEDQLASLVVQLASQLRADSPIDPAPYWMLRALRWAGHDLLRSEQVAEVLANKGRAHIPLPEGHGRLMKEIPRRLGAGQHADVVAECEELFAMNPLWLDLQRFIATGLEAMGAEQARAAVRAQVSLLLRCCPQIAELRFSDRDGTPFADAETLRWLEGEQTGGSRDLAVSVSPAASEQVPEGLLPGVQFLQKQLAQAASGARRFELQLRLVELLLSNERSDIAMPVVEQLLGAIDTHRLVEWQPELCQCAFRLAVRTARAAEVDAARRMALFGRLCQLAPADAVQLGPESLPS